MIHKRVANVSFLSIVCNGDIKHSYSFGATQEFQVNYYTYIFMMNSGSPKSLNSPSAQILFFLSLW